MSDNNLQSNSTPEKESRRPSPGSANYEAAESNLSLQPSDPDPSLFEEDIKTPSSVNEESKEKLSVPTKVNSQEISPLLPPERKSPFEAGNEFVPQEEESESRKIEEETQNLPDEENSTPPPSSPPQKKSSSSTSSNEDRLSTGKLGQEFPLPMRPLLEEESESTKTPPMIDEKISIDSRVNSMIETPVKLDISSGSNDEDHRPSDGPLDRRPSNWLIEESAHIPQTNEALRQILDGEETKSNFKLPTEYGSSSSTEGPPKIDTTVQVTLIKEENVPETSSASKATKYRCAPVQPLTTQHTVFDVLSGREGIPCNECDVADLDDGCGEGENSVFTVVADVILNMIENVVTRLYKVAEDKFTSNNSPEDLLTPTGQHGNAAETEPNMAHTTVPYLDDPNDGGSMTLLDGAEAIEFTVGEDETVHTVNLK